jgi:hypothetical protein
VPAKFASLYSAAEAAAQESQLKLGSAAQETCLPSDYYGQIFNQSAGNGIKGEEQ